MYCKSCGAENPSTANYCFNDGTSLKSISVKYRNKEKSSTFCSNCGTKNSSLTNYCQNCGENLIQYGREKNIMPKLTAGISAPAARRTTNQSIFQLQYIKKAILPALIAVAVVFLLSFSMLKSSEQIYNDLLNNQMGNYNINSLINEINSETNSNLPKAGNLIGISDIVMLANLQNPDITIKGTGAISIFSQSGSIGVVTHNGFLIYLLIPFIALFTAGIFAGRRNNRTNLSDRLYDALGIALLYSVVFTIVSFFAGFHYHFPVKVNPVTVDFDIDTRYSFLRTFFMTLLFGFVFSSLGILFSINFKKITGHLEEWIPSGRAVHQAIIVPFIGLFALFIGLFIYLTSKFSDFKEQIGPEVSGTPIAVLLDKSTSMIASLSVQLGDYVWNLLHLAPLTFLMNSQSESITGSVSYSIFSGFSGTGDTSNGLEFLQSALSSTDIEMYLKFALILPIALFIWSGFRISKQPNQIKNLIVFSIVYAIIMSGIASFSNIGFNVTAGIGTESGNMSMSLGFGALGTFIRSLLFSFVFAYLGTWITKLKANN